jgi:hypothetical protein
VFEGARKTLPLGESAAQEFTIRVIEELFWGGIGGEDKITDPGEVNTIHLRLVYSLRKEYIACFTQNLAVILQMRRKCSSISSN